MFGVLYGGFSYLFFLGVFVFFACFTDGVWVPKTVDGGVAGERWAAAAIDVGLIVLFGLQHSVMARPAFKRRLARVVPPRLERSTYVLVSSAALALLVWQWRPLDTPLWEIRSTPVAAVLWSINAIGWIGVPVSSLLIDHLELFGLKQVWHGFRATTFASKGFVTPSLYRYVRHPMMSSLLVGLWVTPRMTAGHLLLAVGMTVYVVIGVHYEERGLVEALGAGYERYRASTPRFFPLRAPRPVDASPLSGGSR